MREFATGATRDDSTDKLDYEGLLSPIALERYAQYLHGHRRQADGKMRASDNWQKGLPIKECVKSMFRHVIDIWKLNRGYNVVDPKDGHFISTEEACCAVIFNAFAILHEKEKVKHKTSEAKAIISSPILCAPSFPPTQYGGNE